MNKELFDFSININEERDIRILQITDLQPVDISQQRYVGRLRVEIQEFTEEMKYNGMYYYMDEAVKLTKPDLIIVTGDIVYGEFDDSGKLLEEITNHFDSYEIPWAPVFGNHDNECKKGVAWQCSVFENAKNCFFKRNTVTGNGNYNIGIFKNNKLVDVMYMLDSNGCWNGFNYGYLENYPPYNEGEKVQIYQGIYPDQVKWIDDTSKLIDNEYGKNVIKMAAFHIPPRELTLQCVENKYQQDLSGASRETFDLDNPEVALNGDFGKKNERFCDCPTNGLWPIMKDHNFTHVFIGHCHINNCSILTDGIRVTFGIKTGTFDYHSFTGATLITLEKNENKVTIEHKYINK